jgi:hypothetical protein
MKILKRFRRALMTIAATTILLHGSVARAQSSNPPAAGRQVAITSLGLTPKPMPAWFNFLPESVIDTWVVNHNIKDMTTHAWALWGAGTSSTTEQFRGVRAPVYLTWWPQQDVFAAQAPLSQLAVSAHGMRFERPR